MNYYHEEPNLRVGDEIQITAWIKYLYTKDIWLNYKDCNKFISSIVYFKDNSVTFCNDNFYKLPTINSLSLWYWSDFFKKNDIFTELHTTYKNEDANLDIVFVPLISADYNQIREMNLKSIEILFHYLNKISKNFKMVVDINKKNKINLEHENVIYSNSFEQTFELVRKSKIYIGGDTGVTHYAGAIKHPNMILLYGDETDAHKRNLHHREILAKTFNEPELLKSVYSATPCCPQKYKLICIENNQIPINKVLDSLY